MQEFERASLHKDFVNEENNTGSYIFEPLERGFGITIGNTICRTLSVSYTHLTLPTNSRV